jgi:dienelactone hydrolase
MASEWVSILVDGRDMRVYLPPPETTGQVLGVPVTMEAFGVNQYTQEVADKLAREGYVAVALVLYHRLGSNPLFSDTGDEAEARTKATAGAFHWHLSGGRPFERTPNVQCPPLGDFSDT